VFRVEGIGLIISRSGSRDSFWVWGQTGSGMRAWFRASGFEYRVSCFVFWVSGFGYRVSCFVFRVSCFEQCFALCWGSDFEYRGLGLRYRVSCPSFVFRVLCLVCVFRVSCFVFRVSGSGNWFRVSGIGLLVSGTGHQNPGFGFWSGPVRV